MASRFGGKKVAILTGLVAGALLLFWFLSRPDGDSKRGSVASAHPGKKKAGNGGWLPWFTDRNGPGGTRRRDPYRGPRIPVTVKVIDLAGEPVDGAEVEARADPEQYETAGLSDEEYEAFMKEREGEEEQEEEEEFDADAPIPTEAEALTASAKEFEDWIPPEFLPVESGRTDRSGVFVAKLKPDVEVVFHARDGHGREGVSSLLYVYNVEDEASGEMDDIPLTARRATGFEVTIEIAEIGILTGMVVDPRGQPISGAVLNLSAWSSMDMDEDSFLSRKDGERGAPRTGEDGRFRLELRASGAFDLEVHAKKFQPRIEQAVQVLPGRETELNVTLLPSAEISGVVLDPSGHAVSGARVVVQGRPDDKSFASFETTSGEDGTFVAEELAPGRYVVAGSKDGLRPAEVWNVDAGASNVVVRLTAGGSIHGDATADAELLRGMASRVVVEPRWSGEPLEDMGEDAPGAAEGQAEEEPEYFGDVYLALLGGTDDVVPLASGVPRDKASESPSGVLDARGRYFAQLRIDAHGRGDFDVTGLPSGSYTGTATFGTAIASLGVVRVFDGQTANVTLRFPDRNGGSIDGVVVAAAGRAIVDGTVFVYGGSLPTGLSSYVGGDGSFHFPSLPPGEYMVHAVVNVKPAGAADASEAVGAYAPARAVSVGVGSRTTLEIVVEPLDLDLIDLDIDSGEIFDPEGQGDIDGLEENRGPENPDPDHVWTPDLWVEEIDGNLVVTFAPPGRDGSRLFGGDRVTSIDGTTLGSMESWEAMELLYGPKDSMCRITADRPATHETITVSLPRVRSMGDFNDGRMGGHGGLE